MTSSLDHDHTVIGGQLDRAATSDAELTWETAPLNTPLWGVYGPECFPTVFACLLRDYFWHGRAIWGFSVYRRKRGYRTLGTGKDWADRNSLRLFRSREAAFAHIAAHFPAENSPADGAERVQLGGAESPTGTNQGPSQ